MKNRLVKLLSVMLAVVMAFTAIGAVTASALSESEAGDYISKVTDVEGKYSEDVRDGASKWFYNFLDKIIMCAVKSLSVAFAVPDSWVTEDEYAAENFYTGTDEFLDRAADGARWSLGYSNASILDGQDVLDGKHYVAGSIGFSDKFATDVFDDLKVRAVALNDGSGRGTTIFMAVDAYGLAVTEVRHIRSLLADYAQANNINSINISVLHQHSAVDTFGMNGNIYQMALLNPVRTLFGLKDKIVNGKNDEYMENLYNVCVAVAEDACNNLETGTLSYTKCDVSDYLIDKRDPQVDDSNFNIFLFEPDDASSEDTYIIQSMIHCVSFGASTTNVSGDYPYYLEQAMNKAGANMFMYMGAQQSTSLNRNAEEIEILDENMSSVEKVKVIGEDMAERVIAAAEQTKVTVTPLLNVRISEATFSIDNPILAVAGKASMFETNVVKSGFNKYSLISEIGYVEIGDSFAVTMIPGELAPELAYGGTLPASVAWNNTDFDYPSLQEIVGERFVLPMGLCNDQIGYIIPDNNYMSLVAEESGSLEFVSLGKATASTLITDYQQLVESVR